MLLCVAGITVGNMCVLWILVGISGRTVAELCYALSCAGVNLVLLRSTLIESRTNFLIKE